MSTFARILFGLVTLAPLAFGAWLIWWFVSETPIAGASAYGGDVRDLQQGFALRALAFGASSMLALGICIWHLMSRPGARENEQLVWVIVLVAFSAVAWPIYWIVRVLPDRGDVDPRATGSPRPVHGRRRT